MNSPAEDRDESPDGKQHRLHVLKRAMITAPIPIAYSAGFDRLKSKFNGVLSTQSAEILDDTYIGANSPHLKSHNFKPFKAENVVTRHQPFIAVTEDNGHYIALVATARSLDIKPGVLQTSAFEPEIEAHFWAPKDKFVSLEEFELRIHEEISSGRLSLAYEDYQEAYACGITHVSTLTYPPHQAVAHETHKINAQRLHAAQIAIDNAFGGSSPTSESTQPEANTAQAGESVGSSGNIIGQSSALATLSTPERTAPLKAEQQTPAEFRKNLELEVQQIIESNNFSYFLSTYDAAFHQDNRHAPFADIRAQVMTDAFNRMFQVTANSEKANS